MNVFNFIKKKDVANEIAYIKANGIYYKPQIYGVQDPKMIEGVFYPEIKITKMSFGRYKVEGYASSIYDDWGAIIIYPSGIEEIRYKKNIYDF